jgi:hypothetical protein
MTRRVSTKAVMRSTNVGSPPVTIGAESQGERPDTLTPCDYGQTAPRRTSARHAVTTEQWEAYQAALKRVGALPVCPLHLVNDDVILANGSRARLCQTVCSEHLVQFFEEVGKFILEHVPNDL